MNIIPLRVIALLFFCFMPTIAQQKRIKLIICDLAGTTVDCGSQAPTHAFIDVFHANNLQISMQDVRQFMGIEKKEHIRRMLMLNHVTKQFKQCHNCDWNEADVDQMYQAFVPKLLACLPSYAIPIPGLTQTIDHIKTTYGVRIGTCTGYNKQMSDVVLKTAATYGFFPDFSICSSDVQKGRPHGDMIEAIMQMAGITDPCEVLKVGDTQVDIKEGKSLAQAYSSGCWTMGVSATGNFIGKNWSELEKTTNLQNELPHAEQILYAAGADYVAPNINSLPHIIALINARLQAGEKPRS